MHIYFSGIGGTAIGPLALLAREAGYEVSGSDKQQSKYTESLTAQGIDVHIGQDELHIADVHARKPIDWLVYSSAIPREQPDHPELKFAYDNDIRHSKRDKLLNQIITDHNLKLIAIAGTHGKSTTTAMTVWLCQQLGLSISYSLGAKIPFGPMGQFDPKSEYFVYECDEFDRNFLAFHPYLSMITGIAWDHHEIFPTAEDYNQAFRDFLNQSEKQVVWQEDVDILGLQPHDRLQTINENDPGINQITLAGLVNRQNAWQVVQAIKQVTNESTDKLIVIMNRFPGLSQRMEQLAPNLYSDYAHTPEKIRGGLNVALELAKKEGKEVVVVYEPLTNRRQHFIKDDYKDCFAGVKKVYWLPTYLAREDPGQPELSPGELISHLANPEIAEPVEKDDQLIKTIQEHLRQGDVVIGQSTSGGGSLDEWLRQHAAELSR